MIALTLALIGVLLLACSRVLRRAIRRRLIRRRLVLVCPRYHA